MGSIRHWRTLGRILESETQLRSTNHGFRREHGLGSGICKVYNTRAEQTHILAAMIQLFQTGINVLYSVDYTGAIDNSNECEKWTQTEWLSCKNKDVMEGIMHMKSKYKQAGTIFECFHNRGHQETYIPGKKPENYNALERVAVMSDEIAGGVRDNCADWKEVPYIPGRSRFKLMYKGEEVAKPHL